MIVAGRDSTLACRQECPECARLAPDVGGRVVHVNLVTLLTLDNQMISVVVLLCGVDVVV